MSKSLPVTASGRAMSVRHLKEQMKVDKAHAKDHIAAAKDAEKRIKKAQKGKSVGT